MARRMCDICDGAANNFGKFATCDKCRDKAIADAVAHSMAMNKTTSKISGGRNL